MVNSSKRLTSSRPVTTSRLTDGKYTCRLLTFSGERQPADMLLIENATGAAVYTPFLLRNLYTPTCPQLMATGEGTYVQLFEATGYFNQSQDIFCKDRYRIEQLIVKKRLDATWKSYEEILEEGYVIEIGSFDNLKLLVTTNGHLAVTARPDWYMPCLRAATSYISLSKRGAAALKKWEEVHRDNRGVTVKASFKGGASATVTLSYQDSDIHLHVRGQGYISSRWRKM